ncbi:MAG: hypothetical protein QOE33_1008 [Acidobacteriota bacterium]|nr:hypothetical protein [Acidobacteriota bacterium]
MPLAGAAWASAQEARPNDEAKELLRLRAHLDSQYKAIEEMFAAPQTAQHSVASPTPEAMPAAPPHQTTPPPVQDYRNRVRLSAPIRDRKWQDEVARRFARAADTVEQMLKLNPPDAPALGERLETLRLYAQPVSSPDSGRNVFGAMEVDRRAQLKDVPAAPYTPEALAANARAVVRLRLVLAADGSVKHIFPIQSARYGLTESAVMAAGRITFKPAVRNDLTVSQFFTIVYDFKDRRPATPNVPKT